MENYLISDECLASFFSKKEIDLEVFIEKISIFLSHLGLHAKNTTPSSGSIFSSAMFSSIAKKGIKVYYEGDINIEIEVLDFEINISFYSELIAKEKVSKVLATSAYSKLLLVFDEIIRLFGENLVCGVGGSKSTFFSYYSTLSYNYFDSHPFIESLDWMKKPFWFFYLSNEHLKTFPIELAQNAPVEKSKRYDSGLLLFASEFPVLDESKKIYLSAYFKKILEAKK